MSKNPSPDAGCPETFRSLVREWEQVGEQEHTAYTDARKLCAARLSALIDAWDAHVEGYEGVQHSDWWAELWPRVLGPKERG